MIGRGPTGWPSVAGAATTVATVRVVVIGVVAVVLAAGCSFSIGDTPTNVAEEVIEGDLAEQIGITDVEADCEVETSRDVGTTFTCTSTSNIGDIEYRATIEEDDTVFVEPTNVLSPDNISAIEANTPGVDCGDGAVVVGSDDTLTCAYTDPGDGLVYDVFIQFTDLTAGLYDITQADTPRS